MWTIRTANCGLLQRRAFACRLGTAAGHANLVKYTTYAVRYRGIRMSIGVVALVYGDEGKVVRWTTVSPLDMGFGFVRVVAESAARKTRTRKTEDGSYSDN